MKTIINSNIDKLPVTNPSQDLLKKEYPEHEQILKSFKTENVIHHSSKMVRK